jgi:alanine racemase
LGHVPTAEANVRDTSWLEINLAKLDANVDRLRAVTGGKVKLCGAVKADAYGLGVVPIAARLANHGVEMLAVYSQAQAEELFSKVTLSCPVLVLARMDTLSRQDSLYRPAVTGRLHLTIHDLEQITALERVGRMIGLQFPVHLYVDTGMSRGGLTPTQLQQAVTEIATLRHVKIAGVSTHLCSAECDEAFTDEQCATLDRAVAACRGKLPAGVLIHLANTSATLRAKKYHRDMVRVGLGLYGYGDEVIEERGAKNEERAEDTGSEPRSSFFPLRSSRLQPIARWLSRVVHVQEHPRGTPVGYNSTHRLGRDSMLGLVPVGYADGYDRGLSDRSVVGLPECSVDGKPVYAKVLGRVNMDQIVIDLTDAPASCGTLVELISDNPASPCALPRLAELAGTNTYELLCRLSPRLPRRYVS